MRSYGLHELNTHIKRAVAINFQDFYWVNGEVLSCTLSKGHWYVDLVEQNENDQVIAQNKAFLWNTQRKWLEKKHDRSLEDFFEIGANCNLLVDVSYDERYGLQLNIKDIDLSFTLGQLEKQRLETFKRIKAEGLDQINTKLSLPIVLQRIAVISSSTAAGYIDFRQEMDETNENVAIDIQHFQAAMQGRAVVEDFKSAIQQIDHQHFDCIVYVRGGGSRFDLSAFDLYELAEAIAQAPLPIISGIGHEIDSSAADLVSHTAVKTPTAAAHFIKQRNFEFINQLSFLDQRINVSAREKIFNENYRLENNQKTLVSLSNRILQHRLFQVNNTQTTLAYAVNKYIAAQKSILENAALKMKLSSPATILNKGYTITTQNGHIVKTSAQIDFDKNLETRFQDGVVTSKPITN